tara:strand:+ start:426 stop:1028 length:603 start_codon:yes stop_codon:yes gene_type:complete
MGKRQRSDEFVLVFNKPYGVLCQFTGLKPNLSEFIPLKGFYPAGRLDKTSEGLVVLTNSGVVQAKISNPKHKMEKTYWVQVEGNINENLLNDLIKGVVIKGIKTLPAKGKIIAPPLGPRVPDIRYRKNIPTSWIELELKEGRNRQVRRMTAAVGHPTLRLYRVRVGPWNILSTENGHYYKSLISGSLSPKNGQKLDHSPY